MPTPSWTVSFTMPTASSSPAKACAGHEASRTRRLDQPPSPVTQIHRPARLATRAASFRYGGRHHSGTPGDIIPLYPGDFVGIRNPGQQIAQLRRRDRYRFTGNRWPDEPSSLESFGKQACSLAIVPNDLQKIAAFAPEAEETAAHGVALEHFLHAQSQARKATPHVGMARRQPHSHPRRDRDHRSVSSPRMIRSKTATSTLRSTITRRPFAVTTPRVPVAGAARSVVDWTSDTIRAGTN